MKQKWCIAVLLQLLVLVVSLLSGPTVHARSLDPLAGLFDQQAKFLPVEEAFIFDAVQKGDKVIFNWTIADEYYLYADKFQFAIEKADLVKTEQGEATQIEDEFFGVVDVYFFESIITATVANVQPGAVIKVRYQGCAKAGLCYQPVSKTFSLTPFGEQTAASDMAAVLSTEPPTGAKGANEPSQSKQNDLADSLQNSSLILTLAVFFALGVGLAFTPCVFPMFPILSGIIAGQKELTTRKGLYLAFIYVQGMALTYSLLGLVVASFGVQFQAALQHPVILVLVSLIFVALAGAMFGWYNLQLPQSWTSKLTDVSNQQKSGNVLGVFVMGALSGLIASPCTTAPLTGALLYVAQTGDLFIGFFTLYVLSLGMGLPLLLIGASGGKLLPKAGNWMNLIKNVFGFILLSVPLILFERFIELSWVLFMAGALLLCFAAYLHSQYLAASSNATKSGIWLAMWISLASGLLLASQPFSRTMSSQLTGLQASAHKATFTKVVTLSDIEREVALASSRGQVVMLDLYADWCVACKEFEAFTFSDPLVASQMAKMHLLQVDMTDNTKADEEISTEFNVLGLPTIMFFDTQGNELTLQRVTGFMGADAFSKHLAEIL